MVKPAHGLEQLAGALFESLDHTRLGLLADHPTAPRLRDLQARPLCGAVLDGHLLGRQLRSAFSPFTPL